MEHIWLEQIADGQLVDGVYYLRSKSRGTTRAGKPYLNLTLVDRTGDIEARVWDNAEQFDAAAGSGSFVLIQARGNLYNNQMQLVVSYLEPAPESEVDAALFLPVCPREIEPYWQTVRALVESLDDEPLRALALALLDDEELGPRFKTAPAAMNIHQAYLGGLLEHTCSMMLLADRICAHYPALDRNLLLAGTLFHDLGKVRELAYTLSLEYTDEGRLVGHHVFGIQYLGRLAARVESLSAERIMQIEHMILSHHGRPEWGSSKIPMFAEAAVLHYLDNLDAKVFAFLETETKIVAGQWSERVWHLETHIYKPARTQEGYRFALPGAPAATKKAVKADGDELPLFGK